MKTIEIDLDKLNAFNVMLIGLAVAIQIDYKDSVFVVVFLSIPILSYLLVLIQTARNKKKETVGELEN